VKASLWIASLLVLAGLPMACTSSSNNSGGGGNTVNLSPTSTGFAAFVAGSNPPAQNVQVSGSTGSLSGVVAGPVQYAAGQPTGWLDAALNGLTITVTATLGALGAGTYTAHVPVTADNATSASLAVSFQVADCSTTASTNLNVGQTVVLDPAASNGCLSIPAAGPAGAEHLIVALSTQGVSTGSGVSGSYSFLGAPAPAPPAPLPAPRVTTSSSPALAFHSMLRQREQELARDPSRRRLALAPQVAPAPPVVGDQRTFKVCGNLQCNSFVSVTATAKHVGPKGAIYLDNTVPAGGFTDPDISYVGNLFDNYMYPIDTTAFGRESDLDNNGVVIVLLTDAVNNLSPSCNSTGSIVFGYFFGLDLVTDPNSNQGEVFYSLVPNPGNPNCTVSHDEALAGLPPTFIHEFQHMISFNRHFLLTGPGIGTEDAWLNEGLSMYAQELGGRQIPNTECPLFNTAPNPCFSQFAGGNVSDAYDYLDDPETSYLVVPENSPLTLAEYGGAWLFVRWFTQQSPTDTLLAKDMTRALLGADNPQGVSITGSVNIASVAASKGVTWTSWEQLVSQWQLANYLEGVTGFSEPTGQLKYLDWDFRTIYSNPLNNFAKPYPLTPDSTKTGAYTRNGTLRAGSGRHLRVIQNASASAVQLILTTTNTANVLPRFSIIRIR